MKFSAPPDAQGHAGVLTPEDAFVAAANTCVMLMFIWAAERFHLNLLSYECRTEGTKVIELDRTLPKQIKIKQKELDARK